MCDRCSTYFTIHDTAELDNYLNHSITRGTTLFKRSQILARKMELVKILHKRKYFSNLIYLEYMEELKQYE